MQLNNISSNVAESAVNLNLGVRKLQHLLATSSPDAKQIAELATEIRISAGVVRDWAFQAA